MDESRHKENALTLHDLRFLKYVYYLDKESIMLEHISNSYDKILSVTPNIDICQNTWKSFGLCIHWNYSIYSKLINLNWNTLICPNVTRTWVCKWQNNLIMKSTKMYILFYPTLLWQTVAINRVVSMLFEIE